MLRRLEKRILVGLPTTDARRVMFMHHLPPVIFTADCNGFELASDVDYSALAEVVLVLADTQHLNIFIHQCMVERT